MKKNIIIVTLIIILAIIFVYCFINYEPKENVIEDNNLLEEESVVNVPNLNTISSISKEELEKMLVGISKSSIYALWGTPNGTITGRNMDYWNIEGSENPITVDYDSNNTIKSVSLDLKVTHEEFALLSEDLKILLNSEISTFNKEPIKEEEGRGDGFHWKDYTYDDVFVTALVGDDNSTMITRIITTSENYKTTRGIKVGDNLETLKSVYPDCLEKALTNYDENMYIFNPEGDLGFNRIYFSLKDNVITEIKIENGIDG